MYGVSTRATFALGAAALTLTVRRLVLYEPGIADAEDLVTPELGERFDALLATGDGGSSGGPAPAAGSSAPTGSAPVGCGGRPTGPAPQRLVTHRLAGCLSDVMGTKVDRLVLAELSDPDRLGRLGVERFRRFVARRDVRVRTEVTERVARRDVRVSTEVAERLVTADGHGPCRSHRSSSDSIRAALWTVRLPDPDTCRTVPMNSQTSGPTASAARRPVGLSRYTIPEKARGLQPLVQQRRDRLRQCTPSSAAFLARCSARSADNGLG